MASTCWTKQGLKPSSHEVNPAIAATLAAMNPEAEAEAEADELAAAAAELSADAESPADLTGQPGTFRTATKVFAVITLISVVAAVVGEDVVWGLGLTFGGIGFLFTLIIGLSDLVLPAARNRKTADSAVQAYFKCMQTGRWDTALATLAPSARARTVTTPEVKELKSFRKAATRTTVKELKAYWKPFIGSHAGLNRRLAQIKVTPLDVDGHTQRHRVELRIDYYPAWAIAGILIGLWPAIILILVLTKKYKTTFDVTTVKYKSQWWVLDGEFKAPPQVGGQGLDFPTARVV
jgi:hypothetical protein